MRIFLILFTAILIFSDYSYANDIKLNKVDQEIVNHNKKLMVIMNNLEHGNEEMRDTIIDMINEKPENFAPPLFYVLSNVLFDKGEKEEAAFWFYAGQVRARYDANRCGDVSARGSVNILNKKYGDKINKYAFQDTKKLEKLVLDVLEWDKKTPNNYDHRWLNPHGMAYVLRIQGIPNPQSPPPPISLPEDQWPEIKQKTQDDYLIGFKEAILKVEKYKKTLK